LIQKILFFFFVIVIAFIPGGIFISTFLLALYYLVPLFITNNSKKEKAEDPEFTIHFKLDIAKPDAKKTDMKSYSNNTLEEMK